VNEKKAQAVVDLRSVARRIYAAPEDFCMIFEEEMNALYSLAVLLTADREAAEKCFLMALDDCRNASDVFREWSRSWSRRAIVKQAIRQVRPAPRAGSAAEIPVEATQIENIPRRLLQLRPFERFVFAMIVLERYRAQECATLLHCQAGDVERAKTAALQFLGGSSRDDLTLLAGGRTHEPAGIAHPGGNV
jgi:DNA-directed RNA polymerase specialized sigma24 family protein